MRPLLLVIRTGKREFREYLFQSITSRYRIHLFHVAKPDWEHEYLDGSTIVDTADVDAMVTAAKDLQSREHVAGVVAFDEAYLVPAAQVAAALGLAGGDPAVVARCRNRLQATQALAASGVPRPRCLRVDTLPDALVAAGRLGYPTLIKPIDAATRQGVIKVDTAERLATVFDQVRGSVLLEESFDGCEISVDTAVHNGDLFPLYLARKGKTQYVHADDPLLEDPRLLEVLHDTHRALGFTHGVTHTDITMTADGPRISDVSGWLSEDMIPYLGLRASGVDAGLAAAAVARGQPPHIERDRKLVAALRYFYPEHNGTRIESIDFEFADAPPAAVDVLALLPKLGAVKSPPPDGTVNGRIAFAVAVAQTAEECDAALAAAQKALRVNGSPLERQ